MSKSRIKTPLRPDLQLIFNTQQRKPRSFQAKSTKSKSAQSAALVTEDLSASKTKVEQSSVFASGDLLQLFAAKLENETIAQDENLSRKRLRFSDLQERHTRRRVDESQDSSLLLDKNIADSSRDKCISGRKSDADSILEKQNSSNSSFSSLSIAAPNSLSTPNVLGLSTKEIISNVVDRPASPKRLSRGRMLMKSALISHLTPSFPETSNSQRFQSDSSNLRSYNLEPVSADVYSAITEAQVARIANWTSEAKRLISSKLLLPMRLQSLKEVFKAVETTINVHRARRRNSVLFSELSSGVQSIIKKNFTKSSLAQIVYLLPDGYSLQNKSVRNTESGRTENVIAIAMVDFPESVGLNHLQRNQHRLDKFHDCLMKHVFKFYLLWSKINLPDRFEEIEKTGLYSLESWHPAFPLERCPAVPLSLLPTPAVSKFTAELSNLVEDRHVKDFLTVTEDASGHEQTVVAADIPKELQGIPLSLIERVRLKEAAARQLSAQLGTKEMIQTDLELESLPDFVVLVHGIFSAMGKPSMLYSALIAQLKYKIKHQLVSEESIVSRINFLLELLPNFCQKITDGRIEAFRIDLGANVAHLRAELRHSIRQRRLHRPT